MTVLSATGMSQQRLLGMTMAPAAWSPCWWPG
jgi:hypothetical protein